MRPPHSDLKGLRVATGTSGDERDDKLTPSNDEALSADATKESDAELAAAELDADDAEVGGAHVADLDGDDSIADDRVDEIDGEEDVDDADDAAAPAVATAAAATSARGATTKTAERNKPAKADKPAKAEKPAKTKVVTKKNEATKNERNEDDKGSVAQFFREVGTELKKVVTPTRKELWRYVAVVLAFLVIMMIIVTGLDFFFGFISSWVFGNGTDLIPAAPPAPAPAPTAP